MNKTQYELKQDSIKLHQLLDKIVRKFNCFDNNVFKMLDEIPNKSGLMIFFEKGEKFENYPRIVFVGETENFHSRIRAYYKSHAKLVTHIRDALGNKLGKAVLQKDANEYIQENMEFVLLPYENKTKRIELNKKILSTLSYCDSFKASTDWLGNYAPKEYEMITLSRLWAVKYPFGNDVLDEKDFKRLEELISIGE